MQTLLSVGALLLSTPVALGQTVTAVVNDARSHGSVGDTTLSLDEAIRLLNGTLATSALSPAESAQLTGFGTLTRVEVRSTLTPTITCERALSPIRGIPGGGTDAVVEGMRQGNGVPILLVGSAAHGFAVQTNRAQVRGFDIRGGGVGILADTTAAYAIGQYAIFADCTFSAQAEAGVRLVAPSDRQSRRIASRIRRCTFTGLPVGIDIRCESEFGRIDAEGEWLKLTGCNTGVDLASMAPGGNHQWQGFRTDITGAEYCLRLRRQIGDNSEWLVRAVYGSYFGRATAVELDGSTTGADTVFHHHQIDLRGGLGTTNYALLTRPDGARFDLHSSENVFEGNVLIQSGRLSRRMWFHGCRFQNGLLTLHNEGVRPDLQWNVFDATPITVLDTTTQALPFVECEFVRSPITDLTRAGVTTLTGCFSAQSPHGSNVVVQNPTNSAWIARATVAPVDPPRGTFVDLGADLQPGTAGIWWVGYSEPRPVTTNFPFRYYLHVASALVLPLVVTGRSNLRLAIPPQAYLIGVEFHAQPVTFPIAGQTVPPVSLPRGGRFLVQ